MTKVNHIEMLVILGLILFSAIDLRAGYKDDLISDVMTSTGYDKVDKTNKLIDFYFLVSIDTAKLLCEKNIELAESIGYKRGILESKLNLATAYSYARDNDKASELFDEVVDKYKAVGDRNGTAKALLQCCFMYTELYNSTKAIELMEEAQKYIDAQSEDRVLWKYYLYRACILSILNEYFAAFELSVEAGNRFANNSDPEITISILTMQSTQLQRANRLIEAVDLLEQVEDNSNYKPYRVSAYSVNWTIASAFTSLGNYDSAKYYLAKSLKYSETDGNNLGCANSYTLMGHIAGLENDNATERLYYQKAMAYWEIVGIKDRIGNSCLSMASSFIKYRQFQEAIDYCLRAYELGSEVSAYRLLMRSGALLSNLYDSVRDYRSSLYYFIRSNEFNDSITSISNSQKFDNLLRKQKSERSQQINAQKTSSNRRILIIFLGIFAAIIIIGLWAVLRSNRLRAKDNTALQAQTQILYETIDDLNQKKVELNRLNRDLEVMINERTASLEQEINEKMYASDLLKESEEKYRSIVDSIHDGIFILKNTDLQFVNQAFTDITGYRINELLQIEPIGIIVEEDREIFREFFFDNTPESLSRQVDVRLIDYQGNTKFVSVGKNRGRLSGGDEVIIGNIIDVTPFRVAEAGLRTSIKEKETLVKEIHHRVKNNLQIVSSLLSMQSREIKDTGAKAVFVEALQRIKSIALIHEQLYRTEHLSKIKSTDIIPHITGNILSAFKDKGELVDLKTDIDKAYIDIERAIPLALILNELFTNAIKYAVTGDEESVIRIDFKETDVRLYELTVKDCGIGLPKGYDIRNSTGFGMRLITMLSDQLNAETNYRFDNGSVFNVKFRI